MHAFVALVFLGVVATGASAAAQTTTTSGSSTNTGITRADLGSALPANAPGQQLYLQRVTIAPGAKLPEHFHQGTQVARILGGVLTYDIASGTATVTRANGTTETVSAPATVKLRKGDGLVETQGLVHHGSNAGKVPVVIEIASLAPGGRAAVDAGREERDRHAAAGDRGSRLAIAHPPHRRRRRLDDLRLEPARRHRHRRRSTGRGRVARQRELREGERADLRVRHLHLRRRLHPRGAVPGHGHRDHERRRDVVRSDARRGRRHRALRVGHRDRDLHRLAQGSAGHDGGGDVRPDHRGAS